MPPLTEAQKRAKQKYYDGKVKKILLEFYPSDIELYEKVQEQPNKQGYIKELIRKDLEANIIPRKSIHKLDKDIDKALQDGTIDEFIETLKKSIQ